MVFGAREAAWPLIRGDLGLSYAQVGLVLGLPRIASNVVEPLLGILGDTSWRRRVILGGGCIYACALALTAWSPGMLVFLLAALALYPAAGAFVTLGQATLMDHAPAAREKNMARWNLAGAVGVLLGPLALGGMSVAGLGWRWLFAVLAAVSVVAVICVAAIPVGARHHGGALTGFRAGLRQALSVLQRREVLRWLALLEIADLLLDVLLGYLALYLVGAVHASPAQAALAVTLWTAAGLAGSLVLLPLLERISGLRYLRWSAVAAMLLFPAFLLAPGWTAKAGLITLLGFINAGWYPVLQSRLYDAMPGRSGAVLTLGSVAGLPAALVPFAIGLVAQRWGLAAALWPLAIAPVVLLLSLKGSTGAEG